VPAKCAILGAVAAAHILVRCPVSGVAYTEVCFSAYVETSRSCDTASRAWDEERRTKNEERRTENGERRVGVDGTFHVHRLHARVEDGS